MNKKIKKILGLSKILLKDSAQIFNLFNKETKKVDKKNPMFWVFFIVIITVSYVSFKIMDGLNSINQVEIFLYIYPLFLLILFLFQIILNSINLYFFSDDLELILPMPFKADEILISKFITIISNIYFSEFIFAFFPLLIYGIFTMSAMSYYFYLILFLLVFPIFPTLVVSIFVMFFVKISRVIKNKDIFQIIITLIFLFLIFILEFKLTNNIISKEIIIDEIEQSQAEELVKQFYTRVENINKYLIIMNPSINMLKKPNLISILEFFKILIINLFLFFVFIFIGNKFYIKNVLKCNAFYKIKKINRIKFEKKCKKRNKGNSYIIKDLKMLLKNPTYFIQCIYPSLIVMTSIIIIIIKTLPNLREFFASEMGEDFEINMDFYFVSIIVVIIQILFTISNIAITEISREGKNAVLMKYIPVSLYKQYIYKLVPQFIINLLNIIFIIVIEKILFVETLIFIMAYIFVIANLLNLINCMIFLIIDFLNPKLNWDSEYQAIKQNNNRIYQYVISIIIIIVLLYFSNVLLNKNLNIACNITILILLIIIIFINIIVKKYINKIYKKIK